MKNFVRLVQFARRYKVRFGLSIGCAAMVATLFFTELGAVYPLLHILFDSQNPQRWVSEKIVSVDGEILGLQARQSEAQNVLAVGRMRPGEFEGLANDSRCSAMIWNIKKPPCEHTSARRVPPI